MAWSGHTHPSKGYNVCGYHLDYVNVAGVDYCCTRPMKNGKCRKHGGKVLKGIAHPNFKTGVYSKYVSGALAEKYGNARSDPALLSLKDDIALVTARIGELLEVGHFGDLRVTFDALRSAFDQYRTAQEEGNEDRSIMLLDQLDELITSGAADGGQWHELFDTINQKRRLSATQGRLMRDATQMIAAEEVIGIISSFMLSVRTHVQDPIILRFLQADAARLLGTGDGESA